MVCHLLPFTKVGQQCLKCFQCLKAEQRHDVKNMLSVKTDALKNPSVTHVVSVYCTVFPHVYHDLRTDYSEVVSYHYGDIYSYNLDSTYSQIVTTELTFMLLSSNEQFWLQFAPNLRTTNDACNSDKQHNYLKE